MAPRRPDPDAPDPTRSAAARAGHERRARRKRLARMLGAALRRIDPVERRASVLIEAPEEFAEWIIGQAADAAAEWDEPDLVGGPVELPVTIEELRRAHDELQDERERLLDTGIDPASLLELEPIGDVDAGDEQP
jgi:hypothetical protein